MMIVREATSSSMITRQSPTRRRDSARPVSLRRATLPGSSTSRPIAMSTRCLTCRVKPFEILLSAPFELDGPRLCAHESPCLSMISA